MTISPILAMLINVQGGVQICTQLLMDLHEQVAVQGGVVQQVVQQQAAGGHAFSNAVSLLPRELQQQQQKQQVVQQQAAGGGDNNPYHYSVCRSFITVSKTCNIL
jgi:hypothetical protein